MNVLPLPLRSLLGTQWLASNDLYRNFGEYFDVFGGGSSLFASAYIELGWLLLFLLLGYMAGRVKSVCFSRVVVSLKFCFYPLFCAFSILEMRNALGVFTNSSAVVHSYSPR